MGKRHSKTYQVEVSPTRVAQSVIVSLDGAATGFDQWGSIWSQAQYFYLAPVIGVKKRGVPAESRGAD
jgi:hypothetical protein